MSFKQLLKDASDRDKMCTFGYIREQQKALNLFNVPVMLQYFCLQYYFEYDEFERCGSKMEIRGVDKQKVLAIMTKSGRWRESAGWSTAYFKLPINPKLNIDVIYEWTFKIGGDRWICIGIDSDYSSLNQYLFRSKSDHTENVYGIHANGGIYNTSNYMDHDPYGFGYGDTITMRVNMKSHQLSFIKNGIDSKIAIGFCPENIYHVAVSIGLGKAWVKLIDFKAKYI